MKKEIRKALEGVDPSKIVVVTRHSALAEIIASAVGAVETVSHVTAEQVTDKVVVGILPPPLASLTSALVSVDLNIPADQRGVELTAVDMAEMFTGVSVYQTRRFNSVADVRFAEYVEAR